MSDEEPRSFLDTLVDRLAGLLDALGGNGNRLRWRWKRRQLKARESAYRASVLLRSTRGTHKMCPHCRALVPRTDRTCSECGGGLAGVRAPGVSRFLSNILPGSTATTGIIVLLNGLLYLLMLALPVEDSGGGTGSLFGFNGITLIRYGSGYSPLTVLAGEWWRLVTPIFLHGGLIHFAFNTMVLMQLGPLIEEEFGTERFAVVYLACGIGGNIVSQLLRPVNTVGASGAIFGLIGLLLVHAYRRGGVFGANLKSVMWQYVLFGLLMTFMRFVDSFCHAGGFFTGAALGAVVPSGAFRGRGAATFWEVLAAGAVALVLFCFYKMSVQGMESVRLVLGS